MKSIREIFAQLLGNKDSGVFREIPLKVRGKLYASPMPFGAYDRGNRVIKIYRKNRVNHVFMLVTDAELEKKARRNVFKQYEKNNITWSRFIVKDFETPSVEVISNLVNEARERLNNRQHVAVHCHAGVGRTAVAMSCIAIATENFTADEAVNYVKQHMEIMIMPKQKKLIQEFENSLNATDKK